MKKGTLRWGTAAAACALLLLAIWLLTSTGGPAPPADVAAESRLPSRTPELAAPVAVPAVVPGPGMVAEEEVSPPPAPPAPEKPPSRRVVVEGKVVGLGDEPVPGATVILLAPAAVFDVEVAQQAFIADPRPAPEGSDDVFSLMGDGTTSREDGTFRIETPAAPRAGLIAWGGAYANTMVEPFSLEEDVKGLVLRMEPAVAVAGRVMEQASPHLNGREPAPISGVAVALLKPVPGGRWIHLRTEMTDADGRFRTWGWTPGQYGLLAGKEGLRWMLLPEVRVPADGLDIRLRPADTAAVAGRVFLADGSTPAPGVRVRATTRQGNVVLSDTGDAVTDADGRYRVEGLQVGPGDGACWLLVDAECGDLGVATLSERGWRPPGVPDLQLLPRPEGILRGRVVDGSRGGGGPAAGVHLVARATREAPSARQAGQVIERPFTTTRDGAFEVAGLPGEHVFLVAADDEWGWELPKKPMLRVPDAPADGEWRFDFELIPRGRIRGLVTFPDGSPVSGARVLVHQTSDDRAAAAEAVTGEDGRFTLHGVTSQRPVRLRASLGPTLWVDSPAVSLEPGSTLDGMVIRLPVALVAITGRVVDEEGKPRPEVLVNARPAQSEVAMDSHSAWTGTGGRFRFEVPPGYPWYVELQMNGFEHSLSEPIVPGDPVPDLVLRPLPDSK